MQHHLVLLLLLLTCATHATANDILSSGIHLRTLEGEELNLETLRGKVVVITNVACWCGYTGKNYKQLVTLQNKFANSKLAILLFPCNQFGGQEPGTPTEIRDDVEWRGVKKDGIITMMEKIDVNGKNTHPFFVALKKATNSEDRDISWNFDTKWIISNGEVRRFDGGLYPLELEEEIVRLLKIQESTPEL